MKKKHISLKAELETKQKNLINSVTFTIKKIIRNILSLTLPSILITVVFLELTFRFLIPAANMPDLYFDKSQQMIHFDTFRNIKGLYTVGKFARQKSKWRVNNFGWNSPYNYTRDRSKKLRIAVIGDSYIEALMVDNSNIYPCRLQTLSKNSWEVYAFGVSGAPFSQYLHMSRYVSNNFDPDIFIFNIIHNDFDESLSENLKGRTYFKSLTVNSDSSIIEVPPKPYKLSFIKRLLKRSALIRYISFNLKFKSGFHDKDSAEHIPIYNANINVREVSKNQVKIELVVNYICKKIREENPKKKIIIVMDAPRGDIYSDTLSNSNVYFLNKMVERNATKYNLNFIDLTEIFNTDYTKNRKKFNSDLDYHWSDYGHQIIADTLYKFLNK